jgi:hypothetical protein
VLLGELYEDIDRQKSVHYYQRAIALSGSEIERKVIGRKIEKLIC